MAAPMATTSSGFTPLKGSCLKISCTMSITLGMRLIPPTRTTSSISDTCTPASDMHFLHGSAVLFTKVSTSDSYLLRVTVVATCTGPSGPPEMKGKLMSVCLAEDSSILAFSEASRMRCKAILSFDTSKPFSFLNSSRICCVSTISKSSPPKKVSPLVAFTSKTPPAISKTLTSNVPPPKSYTTMVLFLEESLSKPYAKAAAVGSLIIRMTFKPAILPASFVA
mmetsp:Transcript_86821/g.144443  ORF Transcript_86821/g.144443 Transcript_86821/m.144443 type:complete len:223 (-) Transcript_86821:576-1244(-)